MTHDQLGWIANYIWGIADDVLRDLYVRGKYRDVILPMTVLRRLDAVLDPTKQAVLERKARFDEAGIVNQDAGLRAAAPAESRKAGIEPQPKLKPSGVEWLGDVPEHWAVVPVRRHYDVRLGKMLQTGPGTSSDQQVTYLEAKHVQWFSIHGDSLPRMWASRHDMEHFSIRSGDLLVCEGGEGGRSAIVQEITTGRHIIQNALHRVRAHDDDDGSYNPWLQYVLSVAASVGLLKAINTKVTIAHFTADKFKALMIPMPPQGEANLLVAYLDGNTARINKATLLALREIDLLREYRARLIADVVTGEVDVYSLAARDMEAAT